MERANIDLPEPKPDDPRIGTLLGNALGRSHSKPKAVIIGFPSDEGVRRNGGRPGAAEAPDEIRRALYKMTPDAENPSTFIRLIEHTDDVGNLKISGNLEDDQQNLATALRKYLKEQIIPIILGGGHETAFGHFLGYAGANLQTSIFNLDAHTDVRLLKHGKAHSGSPFRQAIEHESKCCSTYSVAGLQPQAVANAHLAYIEEHGGQYVFRNETNSSSISDLIQAQNSNHTMVTFDMDAVDQAYAPGVSAPCTNGITPQIWLKASYLAARNKHVSSFDVSEVNPNFDRDGQTAKLAALTIWHFLRGLSER